MSPQSLGHLISSTHVGIGHDDEEFLAAEPAREVDAASVALEAGRELLQDGVAAVVAVGVVDILEVVDVRKQYR